MRKLVLCSCLLFLFGSLSLQVAHADQGSAPVLALFYAWFGLPSWNASKMADLPVTLYNSADPAVMQQQIAEAQQAGIDAFEVDWIGPNDASGVDRNLQTLLNLAARVHFGITAYVDLDFLTTPSQVISGLRYLARYYSSPAWFHFRGKPLVAIYHVANLPVSTWQSIFQQVDPNHQVFWVGEGVDPSYLQVFDGMTQFSIAWASDPAQQLRKFASWTRAVPGKAWMATVMPGNNDTKLRGAQGFRVARQNGAYYVNTWQAAIATHPDLISITSWNEWFEGTQIEPSRTYGDLYLQLTLQESDAYHYAQGALPTGPDGCHFVLGFATLAHLLGLTVGDCLANQSFSPANGDALQHTTNGLLVWRKADNWTAFTDGYHTWVNGGSYGVCERLNTQRFAWEANPSGLPVIAGTCS
ncbi:MAG: glycoside hydrolase family 99-like domain-containing protein [Chloroflexi bacterium]|nr:glycoside hydrolase family 99-like domain-containing protein [Chloroflexota bacterium]